MPEVFTEAGAGNPYNGRAGPGVLICISFYPSYPDFNPGKTGYVK